MGRGIESTGRAIASGGRGLDPVPVAELPTPIDHRWIIDDPSTQAVLDSEGNLDGVAHNGGNNVDEGSQSVKSDSTYAGGAYHNFLQGSHSAPNYVGNFSNIPPAFDQSGGDVTASVALTYGNIHDIKQKDCIWSSTINYQGQTGRGTAIGTDNSTNNGNPNLGFGNTAFESSVQQLNDVKSISTVGGKIRIVATIDTATPNFDFAVNGTYYHNNTGNFNIGEIGTGGGTMKFGMVQDRESQGFEPENGEISNVTIYPFVLSQSEVQADYDAQPWS